MKLFFGKISQDKGEQHENNFYAGGPKESPWYNGLEIGDYVFPIFGGKIYKLWQVSKFSKTPVSKKSFTEDAVLFDVITTFPIPIHLATQFCRYRYFNIDLTLVNKSTKSTATEQRGFYEIARTSNCPEPANIDLLDSRNIIIQVEGSVYSFKEGDVRILVKIMDNEYVIKDIQVFESGNFVRYQVLWDLYDKKNKDKYSLQELLKYAESDDASKKKIYLNAVITDLDDKRYFVTSSPISLYDNILVGRKKGIKKSSHSPNNEEENEIDEENDNQKFEEYLPYVDLLNFNPNLILYGPPGTGKTYTAQRIVEAFEYSLNGNSPVAFKDIKDEGRVEFVTFHQSYSYEEFIEGIRPIIKSSEDEESEKNEIKYEIKPGILRNIANNASLNVLKENEQDLSLVDLNKESKIYKISLGQRNSFDRNYEKCKAENIIAINWLKSFDLFGKDYDFIYNQLKDIKDGSANPRNDASSINLFVNTLNIGDIVFIYDSPFKIRDIGIVTSDYIYNSKTKEFPHTRKVKWIKEFKTPFDIGPYNGNIRLTLKTIYPLDRITFDDLASILGNNEEIKTNKPKSSKPFFILIDEINRGNISKIFGELITLIEKDKRDTLKLTLPYSQKPFTLPSNLFFIGTMNTADRSIAVLDTALRRRFVFKELEPDSAIIDSSENPIIEGKIKLSELLDAINARIEKIYDRDHRIGHSYFLNAVNIKTLQQVWYYQIIPLLMEYFYNDLEKVSKIIGAAFIDIKLQSVISNLSDEDFMASILKIDING